MSSLPPFPIKVYHYYITRNWTILNYDKLFICFFDSTDIPSSKISHHNNVKIYNAFFCRHSTQHVLVALSRYYRASVGTVMNYAKKIVVFITMHMLLEGIIDKESSWNTRFFITSTFISNTRLR